MDPEELSHPLVDPEVGGLSDVAASLKTVSSPAPVAIGRPHAGQNLL